MENSIGEVFTLLKHHKTPQFYQGALRRADISTGSVQLAQHRKHLALFPVSFTHSHCSAFLLPSHCNAMFP